MTVSDTLPADQDFRCPSCGGTGMWNQRRANCYGQIECFNCRGTGKMKTSLAARTKARAHRAERKARARAADVEAAQASNDAHGDLFDWLRANSDWNDFARSLTEQHQSGRSWSDNQVRAAQSMRAKCEAKRAAKAEAHAVDLTPIAVMFATAAQSGHKRPLYRAEGVRLKPGRDGALYVLCDERTELGHYGEQPMYLGKVVAGEFLPGRNALPETAAALEAIAADPHAAALKYGQRTGRCSCCGRLLTKHASIDLGIGPICAAKWGLA